jgi:hypothetical protein
MIPNLQPLYGALLGQQQQALILPEPPHGTPLEQNSHEIVQDSIQQELMLLEQQHVISMSDNQRMRTALVRTQDQMGRIQSANQESVLILEEKNSILTEQLSTANSKIVVLEEKIEQMIENDRLRQEENRALQEQVNKLFTWMSTEQNTRSTQINNLTIGQSQLSDQIAAEKKRSVIQDIVVLEKFEAIETRQLNLKESMNQELSSVQRQFTGMEGRVENVSNFTIDTNNRLTNVVESVEKMDARITSVRNDLSTNVIGLVATDNAIIHKVDHNYNTLFNFFNGQRRK